MKLLIAIPALDEEASIGSVIDRCLEARDEILAASPVTEVAITVVSDGSTDRTVEIARSYGDRISLIVFPENCGYGAAITEAWRRSDADLLGFLDGDGTCDPRQFARLCAELHSKNADIAIGNRLTANSRMPLLRRVGNVLFAVLLSAVARRRVRDVASGMRVVRRDSLTRIFPLPSGLQFTPAMSARAILSRDLEIVEIDMPYHEREGKSKLHPLRDGLRFLSVILETAFLYRPTRLASGVAAGLFAATGVMLLYPAWFYLENDRLEEWMIYRFLVGRLLSTIAVLICCATYLGQKAANISLSERPAEDKYLGLSGRFFGQRWFWWAPFLLFWIGLAFVREALIAYLKTGEVHEHWSRFMAMTFFFSLAAILLVTKAVDFCLNLLADRLHYLRHRAPDRPPA